MELILKPIAYVSVYILIGLVINELLQMAADRDEAVDILKNHSIITVIFYPLILLLIIYNFIRGKGDRLFIIMVLVLISGCLVIGLVEVLLGNFSF
ncbi:MAG: hypothetical protein LBK66_08845 [Spirochaetaceae bacterium]|jgi:hypothetical protein|nr:hypothetical protein [Spirochaetaceae bacterium]